MWVHSAGRGHAAPQRESRAHALPLPPPPLPGQDGVWTASVPSPRPAPRSEDKAAVARRNKVTHSTHWARGRPGLAGRGPTPAAPTGHSREPARPSRAEQARPGPHQAGVCRQEAGPPGCPRRALVHVRKAEGERAEALKWTSGAHRATCPQPWPLGSEGALSPPGGVFRGGPCHGSLGSESATSRRV